MNKFLFSILVLIVATVSVKAQNFDFKPGAGDWGTEVNFTPFSSSPIEIDYIKFRKFVKDDEALRMSILFDFKHQNNIDNDQYTQDADVTRKTYEISIRPGYENHFEGTDRLSPYFGFEMDFAYKVSESQTEINGEEWTTEGAWDEDGTERGFTRLGVNLILGADFYFTKRMYLGVEFGYGYHLLDQQKIKVKREGYPADEVKGGSSYTAGSYANNAIKLGFNF